MRTLKAGHPLNSKSADEGEHLSDNTACCMLEFNKSQIAFLFSHIGFVRSSRNSLPLTIHVQLQCRGVHASTQCLLL